MSDTMRRRDRLSSRLKSFLHRSPSRQESPRPQTPNEPALRQGPTEAIANQGGPESRSPDKQISQEILPSRSGVTISATTSTAPGLQHSISRTSTPEAPPAPLASRGPQRSDVTTVPSVIVSPSPSDSPEPPRNVAFAQALQEHINGLKEDEKAAFQHASRGISEKNILHGLQGLGDDHMQNSLLRRHSESLTKFLGLLDRFLGGVGIAIQQSPDVSSLVVGGVRLLIDLAKDFTSFFDRLSRMMVEIDDLLDVLAKYAQTARDNSLICTTLAAVYGDILKFYRDARRVFINRNQERKKHVSITVFFRSQWEPFEGRFGDIRLSMQHHLRVLSHAATATMVGQEEERKQRALVKDREDFLHWISTASHNEKHTAVYEKRHPGTGDWFLRTSEFQQWRSSATAALLWCYGKPGSGKSVLASHVVEAILEQYGADEKVGVCFAYYDYTQSASQGFSRIIRSLIKQLCRKADTIPDAFKKAKQNADSPSTLANLNHFTTITSKFEKVFLIIDALDECLEDDERPRMLCFLAEALGHISHIRVFVTSRRESDIVHKFEALGMPTIQLEAESVAADIEKYVTNEVSRLRSEKELYIINEELAEKVVRTLTDRAEGMFLWVNLQLQQLCKASQRRKNYYVERALEKLPTGLDDTYHRVAKQIENYDDGMKYLAIACFMWVFYAERPLTMNELRHAVAITDGHTDLQKSWPEPEQEESILNACANMLEMDFQRVVRPIHYSVQEFFTKPANIDQGDFAQLGQRYYSHQTLATTCIDELGYRLQSGPCRNTLELYNRTDDSPFVWYAARHFDIHTSKVGDLSEDFLQKLKSLVTLDESYHAALHQFRVVSPYSGSQHHPNVFRDFVLPSSMSGISTIFGSLLFHVHELRELWEEGKIAKGTIHQAAAIGLLKAVEHLLDQENIVDEKDELGVTALYHAAKEGRKDVVELLINREGDVNAQGGHYGNALQAASWGGHIKVVQTLLDKGANVNAQGGEYGNALQAASEGGYIEVVETLLDKGANVNAQGGHYGNALQAASSKGHEEVVQTLLDKGADVNAQGGLYGNALYAACAGGKKQVFELLLSSGADLNYTDFLGRSIIHTAAIDLSVVLWDLLCKLGLHFNLPDNHCWRPAHWAAYFGNTKMLEALMSAGVEMVCTDWQGWTPYEVAQFAGHADTLKFICPLAQYQQGYDVGVEPGEEISGYCNSCTHGLVGAQYHCISCPSPGYDLCFRCFRDVEVLHGHHRFQEDFRYPPG